MYREMLIATKMKEFRYIWRTSDHFSVFHTKYHFYWLKFVQLRVIFATFMSISSTRRKKKEITTNDDNFQSMSIQMVYNLYTLRKDWFCQI